MYLKVALWSAVVAVTLAHPSDLPGYVGPARPTPSYQAPARPAPSYQAPAQYADGPVRYDTQYAVRDDYSGNDFGHQESRDGYDTQGSYRVLLPDGRVQTVTYYVNGDSGYVAEVTYEGEAYYPETYGRGPSYGPTPAPTYS